MTTWRYWFALHPDVPRPIGGVKQVHRLAETLGRLGRQATIVQEAAGFHPGWFRSRVATTSREEFLRREDLDPARDVVVLPETFLPLLERYRPGLPKLIFNQNGSYSFGLRDRRDFPKPDRVLDLYRHPDVRAVLCVSEHDRRLLACGLAGDPARVHRLVCAIETDLFRPGGAKRAAVAFMPRKGTGAEAAIVLALLRRQSWFRGWGMEVIDGLPQPAVVERLRSCLAFLSFSGREGFGLPLAEARACGCFLIGYTGLGGTEVFNAAPEQATAIAVAEGDWAAVVAALAELEKQRQADAPQLAARLLSASKLVRRQYGPAAMLRSVAEALPRWEAQLS
jgi:hypothetical protein